MKAINNLVQASKSLINAGTSSINVGAQLIADGANLMNGSVEEAPKVVGALLTTPFAAAKGFLMEAEGVSADVAEERAYKYLKQELSRTIEEVGVGSGKLLADLLKEDDMDVSKVTKEVTIQEDFNGVH